MADTGAHSLKMRQVGIALGGGGARGIAHIGVLRALRDQPEFLPAMAAGTSAGSIVAALYCAGVGQVQMEAEIRRFDWFRHVIDFQDTLRNLVEHGSKGLVSNSKLEDTMNELLDGRGFSDLNMDLAVTATDIDEKRRIIFTTPQNAPKIKKRILESFLPAGRGEKPGCDTIIISDYENIGKVVSASCAIPGLFQPVIIAGMRLVDGAIVDQVPVDVVRAMGADTVIGISLSFSVMPERASNLSSIFSTIIGMLGVQQLRKSLDLADIGFEIPGIDQRSMFDTHQYDLIDLGNLAMTRHLNLHRKRLRYGVASRVVRWLFGKS